MLVEVLDEIESRLVKLGIEVVRGPQTVPGRKLDYPKERRREEVVLTPALEQEVERILEGIRETRERPTPPEVPLP